MKNPFLCGFRQSLFSSSDINQFVFCHRRWRFCEPVTISSYFLEPLYMYQFYPNLAQSISRKKRFESVHEESRPLKFFQIITSGIYGKIFFTKTRKTKLFMETSSGFLDLRLFKSLYLGMVWATMGDDVLHRITKRKSFKNLLINHVARNAETCLETFP